MEWELHLRFDRWSNQLHSPQGTPCRWFCRQCTSFEVYSDCSSLDCLLDCESHLDRLDIGLSCMLQGQSEWLGWQVILLLWRGNRSLHRHLLQNTLGPKMMGMFQLVKPIKKSTYKLILKIMLRRFERMQSYGSYITHCITHHTHVVVLENLRQDSKHRFLCSLGRLQSG